MNKIKLIFYFGFAGILPVIFFRTKELLDGANASLDGDYFLSILVGLVVSYCVTASVSAAVMLLPIRLFEKYLPWERNIWKRFFADLIITPIVAMAAMYVIFHILMVFDLVQSPAGSYVKELQSYLETGVVMDLLLVTFYEGIYLFRQWKESLIRTERLEKENMITKFEALKNQVNPHFLFNSLNTLSSLVHEDPHKSEEFIDEFSSIYRYILEKQEKMVSTVEEEIRFIRSFFHLLKIRFGDGLVTEIHIEEQKLNHYIPTLALQLLVENAIKHNQVTKKDPLIIRIESNDRYLTVSNNYQPRSENIGSTKVGLNNLTERYTMLCDELSPEFYVNENDYVAKIPLIEME